MISPRNPPPRTTTVSPSFRSPRPDRVDAASRRFQGDGSARRYFRRQLVNDGVGGKDHVLAPAAVQVESEEQRVVAEIGPSPPAVVATTARDDLLGDDRVPGLHVVAFAGALAEAFDDARELVPRDHRARVLDGPLSTEDRGIVDPHSHPGHPDQDLVAAGGRHIHRFVSKITRAVGQYRIHLGRRHVSIQGLWVDGRRGTIDSSPFVEHAFHPLSTREFTSFTPPARSIRSLDA